MDFLWVDGWFGEWVGGCLVNGWVGEWVFGGCLVNV